VFSKPAARGVDLRTDADCRRALGTLGPESFGFAHPQSLPTGLSKGEIDERQR